MPGPDWTHTSNVVSTLTGRRRRAVIDEHRTIDAIGRKGDLLMEVAAIDRDCQLRLATLGKVKSLAGVVDDERAVDALPCNDTRSCPARGDRRAVRLPRETLV